MKTKLYPNIKRMTNLFCIGILCVTLSAVGLRFVFSDMALVSTAGATDILTGSEADGGDGSILYEINARPYYAKADGKGSLMISNPETNEYIITVNIVLQDGGDTVFSSGFINPGTSRANERMDAAGQLLEEGVYPCIAEITAYDSDTLKSLGMVDVEIELYIGEKPEK